MNITRSQHYVWRKYLRAWASREQIWCLRAGKLFPSGLMGVGQEKDFYRISEMSPADIKFLRDFCSVQAPDLGRLNLNWVKMFNHIFELKNRMLSLGADAARMEPAMNAACIQLADSFQGAIEQKGVHPLDSLIKGDTSFYKNVQTKIDFVHFLCVQYTRTKGMKERSLSDEFRLEGINAQAIWNVMAQIIATSLGSSLIREQYELYLLRNCTETAFITGDQPVINIHASFLDPGAPVKDLDFYYPVSPNLAVLVALEPPDDSNLDENSVRKYNDLMMHHSHEQIYAANREDLECYMPTA